MLFPAEKVSGATYFQIAHSNFKARTEFRKFLYRLEALFRHFRKDFIPSVEKVCVSHATASADTAAHLIQLGQAEAIGVIYDNRIGISYVQTVFHQTGTQKKVIIPFIEIKHRRFQE